MSVKRIKISLFLALFVSLGYGEGLATFENLGAPSVLKNGIYRSLGIYGGYYHYGEVRHGGERIMRMDTIMLGLSAQLGLAASNGIKLESSARLNYALGLYSGGILDTDNPSRNGQTLHSITGAIAADVELKGGYALMRNAQSTLYLQSGLGYHLNRTEVLAMDRIQGYLYIPFELEGQYLLTQRKSFDYGVGYRYLIVGNHFSATSKYGFTSDYRVNQTSGFGLSAFVGSSFIKDGVLRSLRLVYEYWHIGAAEPFTTTNAFSGNPATLYEPGNSTHRLFVQYSYGF